MTPYRRHVRVVLAVAATLAACGFARSQSEDVPDALNPPSSGELFRPPDRPLDERINPDKVTEYDPPPLPQRIVLPRSPQYRISSEPAQVPITPEVWQAANDALKGGLDFLRSQQDSSGLWMKAAMAVPTDQPDQPSPVSVAVTSLALKAFVQADEKALDDPQLRKALRAIVAAQKPDGSFDNGSLANYVTSSVLMALAAVEDKDHHDL